MRTAIPFCALAAMLVVGGCRLFHEQEAVVQGRSPLRPMRPSPESVALEIIWARYPLGEAELDDAVWSHIDETQIAPAARRELARNGFRVHATDIAPGMLERLREKVDRFQLSDRVSVQDCSFMSLDQVRGGPFDAVFSDLGGLNCTSDLRPVTHSLPGLLRPGGIAIWVLMPPICLWELATALVGNVRFAFRRLARGGTRAHLEGKYFKVYYFTPRQAIASFGPGFSPLAVEGLSVFAPPAEIKDLPKRHHRLYSALCWLDDRLASHPPFRGWGDFFIATLRYVP